jgi:flagellar biosynthetic protein FlhB
MAPVLRLHWATPARAVAAMAALVFGLTLRVAIGLAAIAAFDLLFQKWKHRRDLRMTRQELKEERKQYEISPELRGRIRAVQIQMARRRMLQEVPKADVVVTNPDHVAVALAYDADAMNAPRVVAKGADFLCQKVKEIARAHGVPVVHRPELARALYATVDVGQEIPETLFVAVAEVLAMIYRMHSKHRKPQTHGDSRS